MNQAIAANPTILFAGGGSGGHLYPGISVAEALVKAIPSVRPLFLCTEREIDQTILGPTGFEYIRQPIVPPVRSAGGLLKFWRNWRATQEIVQNVITEQAPAAVLGLGGYAAGVAVKLASKSGIPGAILNPDVVPGKANRFLMKFVRSVCCQFDATADHVEESQKPKLTTTGCPVRRDLREPVERKAALQRLGLESRLQTLVITGASQGAATVNDAVLETLLRLRQEGSLLQGWQVLHLAGKDHAEKVRAEYRTILGDADVPVRVVDFTPGMADVWSVADLAISRSGASSLAELTTLGVPSVLMPYPFHKDKHQTSNAKVLADAGAAVLLDDQKDRTRNADQLIPTLKGLLYDASRRSQMATAAKTLAKPDAAERVAHVLRAMTEPSA
ncbi:MAG: UDP-N-acetylglucosamine--N-acetylmuramyl-(pentapeptide) pyrophosphoryl-undecaprenol N-acetylglucosamine transferase [Planctomycetota bacterium]